MKRPGSRLQRTVFLLRLNALVLMFAFPAVVMPTRWMQAAHVALQLGEFHATPLFEYLTRSLSMVYGCVGILTWLLAGDPVRYQPLIRMWARACLLLGVVFSLLDIIVHMPWYWAVIEGVYLIGMGFTINGLVRADFDAEPERTNES